MPVEQVPGFWDYFGQGVNQGIERSREDTKLKTQQNEANASLMGQLFQAGAVDSGSLNNALHRAGVPQSVVLPGKAERRKTALETPGAIENMDDEQRAELGFKTRTEKKVEAAKGAEADFATTRANAMTKFANGDDLTDIEAEVTGFKNKKDRELERLKSMDPFLDQVGERFVAGAINQNPNGKIAPGQAKAVSEKAYADYVANRAQAGLGSLTPQEVQYTRSFFDRATQNAIIAQAKLDIAADEAAGRLKAAQDRGGTNQSVAWFKAINTSVDTLRKKQDDLLKANPALAVAINNPQFAQNPMIAGALREYMEAGQKIEAYRGAQASIANGTVPPNLNEVLASAQADMVPPKGAPGGAPPASQGPTKVDQAVQMITGGQGTLEQLQAAVKAGAFTAAEYEQVLQKVNAAKKGMKK